MKGFPVFVAYCSVPTLAHGSIDVAPECRSASPHFLRDIRLCSKKDTSCVVGSIVFFKCDPGFHLIGYGYATCRGREEWYPTPPKCIGKDLVAVGEYMLCYKCYFYSCLNLVH